MEDLNGRRTGAGGAMLQEGNARRLLGAKMPQAVRESSAEDDGTAASERKQVLLMKY